MRNFAPCLQLRDERTGEVITHVEIVRINQKSQVDPFLCALELAKNRQRVHTKTHRIAVAAIMHNGLFGTRKRDLRGTPSGAQIFEGSVDGDQHAWRAKVRFHDSGRLLKMARGLLQSMLSKVKLG